MKRYEGKRSCGQCYVTVDGHALDPRFDLRMHSPEGCEWGYGGSGPAHLALALLADHLNNDPEALNLYQRFKWSLVADLPRRGWSLTSHEIDHTIHRIREQDAVAGGAV